MSARNKFRPSVHTPTALIVGDADAPAEREEAEYVASLMPNATVRVLRGRSGLQTDEQMAIIRELGGIERPPAISTVLVTVLFTDIVDSTRKQAELGDRRWRELVLEHHAAVRGALSDWEGTEHDTAGDGFLATFDGPAFAIRCATAIRDGVRRLGLEVRAGGLAVHIGARVAAAVDPGQVLVVTTVKDLVAGSGLRSETAARRPSRGF